MGEKYYDGSDLLIVAVGVSAIVFLLMWVAVANIHSNPELFVEEWFYGNELNHTERDLPLSKCGLAGFVADLNRGEQGLIHDAVKSCDYICWFISEYDGEDFWGMKCVWPERISEGDFE